LNTMYISYASKSTSCMGDPSPPITTNYVSWKGGLYIALFKSMKSLECNGWNMGLVFMKELIIS
jgi:hypothetical protein